MNRDDKLLNNIVQRPGTGLCSDSTIYDDGRG